MHTLPKTELDCAVELDSHEHRVLHYLSRRMKGRHHLADYDMAAFSKRAVQDQAEMIWALQRLQGYGLLEKVADCQVKVLVPCTCEGHKGMYDRNQTPPVLPEALRQQLLEDPNQPEECEVGPDRDENGELIAIDFVAGRKLTAEEVAAQKAALTRTKAPLTGGGSGSPLTKGLRSERAATQSTTWSPDGAEAKSPSSSSSCSSSRGGMEESASSQNDMAAGGDMVPPPKWTAYRLASYFADECRRRCWGKSAEPVNQKALAKRISGWRKAGTKDADIVKAMDTFIGRAASSPRKRESLWRTFASQIDALLAQQGTGTGSDRGESIRHDREAWVTDSSAEDPRRHDREAWL